MSNTEKQNIGILQINFICDKITRNLHAWRLLKKECLYDRPPHRNDNSTQKSLSQTDLLGA